jgi:hypothetical protein
MNGCWNREPLRHDLTVQTTWVYEFDSNYEAVSRKPYLVDIDVPMTKTCQYQKLTKDDPKCVGCRELEVV